MTSRIAALGALLIAAIAGAPAAAQLFGGGGGFDSKARLLDGKLSGQYAASTRLQPRSIPRREIAGPATVGYSGPATSPWIAEARAAARRHGIPEGLFLRLVRQESGWNPRARSHKGALGLAQLMPGTARQLGVDPLDPAQNLDGGARYLARMKRMFGTWRLALAAYNAGPGAVQQHGGVPPFRETRTYVRRILGSS